MIDGFINSIGGYNSWQFVAMSFGSLAIGLALYLFRWYTFPIVAFGILLIYFYINATAIKAVVESGNSYVSIVPIFYILMMIVLLVGIKNHSLISSKERRE